MQKVVDIELKESKKAIRSHAHKVIDLNVGKYDQLMKILFEYRRVACIMMSMQVNHFYETGRINSFAKDFYGDIKTFLSERYKDVIKRQVDGMMKSWISNRKNDFKKIVEGSKLNKDQKKQLHYINRSQHWFHKENHLARKIFNQAIKKNNFPCAKHMNMQLNTKVYSLESNETTTSCSYHVVLNTCISRGDTITIPLLTNSRFNDIMMNESGKRNLNICNSIQVNFDKKNNLKGVTLSVEYDVFDKKKDLDKYQPKMAKIGIDFGLKSLFATSKGELLGRSFMRKMVNYDKKIQALTKELQKRKIKFGENKRYKRLVGKLRSFIKNEIGRVLNRLVKKHNPGTIVLEDLEFRNIDLSKRMNRILSNCGMSHVKVKMNLLNEDYGIDIEYVNAAYTSQECDDCHFVSEKNRKKQDSFECVCCGHKQQADIKASRTIVGRSNDQWFINNKFANRIKIKQHLLDKCQVVFRDRGWSSVHVDKMISLEKSSLSSKG